MARILLAEDEVLVRELALEDLSDAGFDVVGAGDGDEALEIIEADRNFDLLFTDVRMPGSIDGWQLAERARTLIPGLKVVYSSGLDDPGRELGSTDRLLPKPYRLDALLKTLQDLAP